MTPPLKVLVDVGVGKAVEVWFRQAGHAHRTLAGPRKKVRNSVETRGNSVGEAQPSISTVFYDCRNLLILKRVTAILFLPPSTSFYLFLSSWRYNGSMDVLML